MTKVNLETETNYSDNVNFYYSKEDRVSSFVKRTGVTGDSLAPFMFNGKELRKYSPSGTFSKSKHSSISACEKSVE